MSGMLRFFASAQYEVNSKELLVLLLERDQAAFVASFTRRSRVVLE